MHDILGVLLYQKFLDPLLQHLVCRLVSHVLLAVWTSCQFCFCCSLAACFCVFVCVVVLVLDDDVRDVVRDVLDFRDVRDVTEEAALPTDEAEEDTLLWSDDRVDDGEEDDNDADAVNVVDLVNGDDGDEGTFEPRDLAEPSLEPTAIALVLLLAPEEEPTVIPVLLDLVLLLLLLSSSSMRLLGR